MPLLYILLLLLPPAVFVGGSYYVRHRDQAAKDAQRSTYELTFPAKTDAEQAAKWLKVISGTRRGWFDRFLGTPTIAFEMWATSRGIRHRVRLTHAGHVIPQLQAKIPGIRVERVREEDALDWTEVRELGEQVPTRTLYIKDAEELAESLLTAMQPLQHDETLLLQWVLSPAPRSKPPAEADVIFSDRFHLRHLASGNRARKDEVADRRQKLAEPNYNGVLRIAAKAPHPLAAAELLNRITEVLASTDNYPNRFVRLKTFKGDRMSERIRLASGSVAARPPVTVSVAELTGLLGWPIGSPNVPGLPQGRARQLPANDAIPRVGNVLARSNFSGDERPIALSPKHALQHVHVMGPTGCLHPDTPILDPADGTTRTVRERYLKGRAFHVFAKDGERVVVAAAAPPVRYRRVDMFEVYNGEHRVLVTGQHKIWDGRRYVEATDLYRQQGSDGVRLPTISASGLLRLRQDVQRCWETVEGSQAGHRPVSRFGGLPPLQAAGSGRPYPPSRVDAVEPCSRGRDADGLARTAERSLLYRSALRHASERSSIRAILGRGWRRLAGGGTWLRSSCSRPTSGKCPDRYDPTDRGQRTGLSAQCSMLSPSGELLFNAYSQYSKFRVRPAGCETYYDFHVPLYQNYLAAGLIHHNSGKSVAMANQALQDIDQGHGVIIIDPKPDNLSDNTFQMVLDRIPAHRIDDVVILDIRDQDYPAGFNLLQGNPESVANDLQRLMDSVFPVNAGGMMLQESIYHSVLTLMTSSAASSPMTISEILPLCVPRAADVVFADQLTRGLKDEQLLHYWQDIDQGHVKDRARNFEPLKRRIWQLDRPKLRNIFGQSQSTIDLRDVLSNQKILLINLAGEDEKVLELFGALLMMGIWSAVQSGACSPIRPVFMYIDEVQKLLHMPVSLAEMMQEARSQGLGLRLAHQHLAQLNARRDLLPNIMANARTRMVFQMQHDDAQVMARAFGTEIGVNDLTNLGQYEVMLKVMTEKGVSRAVTGTTADVGKKTGYAERIRAESRRKYGRPRAEVEAEIKARRQAVGGDSAAELDDRAPAWAKKGRRSSESDAS